MGFPPVPVWVPPPVLPAVAAGLEEPDRGGGHKVYTNSEKQPQSVLTLNRNTPVGIFSVVVNVAVPVPLATVSG